MREQKALFSRGAHYIFYYILAFIHHFRCCIRHFFITFAVAIDLMNFHFLINIMHQISTRIKEIKYIKYSFVFSRFTRFCGFCC
jgi:hypothetical protein